MDISDVVELSRLWHQMGWAIQSQLDKILNGNAVRTLCEERLINPNALELMKPFLAMAADRGIEGAGDILEEIELYESDE